MQIHFLRHATFVITVNDLNILVDPLFSPARAMGPIANAGNQLRIPLVDLPLSDTERHLLHSIAAQAVKISPDFHR